MPIWESSILLKLENINTYYGDVQALQNISFEIKESQIVSIIGSNGAGKSTTLNTISGIVRCLSGTIEFISKRIENYFPHQIVGLVQRGVKPPLFTVLRHLASGFPLAFRERVIKKVPKGLTCYARSMVSTADIVPRVAKDFAGRG
jgi:ABC-type sugar transport system ATPase subunit